MLDQLFKQDLSQCTTVLRSTGGRCNNQVSLTRIAGKSKLKTKIMSSKQEEYSPHFSHPVEIEIPVATYYISIYNNVSILFFIHLE